MRAMILVAPSKFSRNVPRDLIYGCWCKGKRIAGIQFPPVSQLLTATVLREDGHDVYFNDAAALGKTRQDLCGEVGEYDLVILLTSTMTVKEDAELLRELKQANPRLKTLVFGAHPTFMPQATLARAGIDFIATSEAEFSIRDLLRAMERGDGSWRGALGIGYREGDQIGINAPYPFIDPLDLLPIPDRSMLPADVEYFNPIVKRMPFTTMYTTRGCPARCTYCTSPPFYGKSLRQMSPERVLKEMRVVQELGYREVFFRDEIFLVTKDRVRQICEGILRERIDLTWICSCRVNSLDSEIMRLMKEAGCHMIRFGVESGVDEILRNVKKGQNTAQIRRTFEWTHQIGLDTHAHMMLGMPGDTHETIQRTINFVKEIDPTIVTFGICTPYAGTELFQQVREVRPEIGDGADLDLGTLHSDSFFNQVYTSLSSEELAGYVRQAYKEFYLRPGYVAKWFKRISSLDELRRVTMAGVNVFGYMMGQDS